MIQTPEQLEAAVREAIGPGLLLVRTLGEGGMGSVFLAREPALKRLVAVKVLAPHLAAQPNARARFEREAQAVAGLVHPNVVAIHGVGELADGTPYFVMQHVSGRSMAARLEADGPLDMDEARRVVGEVALALAAAHAKGIIHRDIKPANILYDEESGRVLVSDFGIAALRDTGGAERDTKLTQTGMIIGTPQYMSPEQLLNEPVTERTDVYALGILGYELVAGCGPFTATTPQELIAMHLRDQPPRLSAKRVDVDLELEALIAGCLNKDPAKRPTAADVARRLAPGAGVPLEWPPPGLDQLHGSLHRLSRQFWLGGLALVAAMLGFVVMGTQLSSAATSLGNIAFSLLTVVGTVAMIRAIHSLVIDSRRALHALGLGYSWLTIAESAADGRGDSGALLTGVREYAALDAPARGDLRRRRVASATLSFGGALLPVPLMLAVTWLAGFGLVGPEAAPWIILGPPLAAIAAAAGLERREQRLVTAGRRQLRQRRGRVSNLPRLVEPWYASYDSSTRDQMVGRGPGGRRALAVGLVFGWSALTLAAVIVLTPLWIVGAVGPAVWDGMQPKIEATQEKYRIANITRDFIPARDPSIAPRQAGAAFWSLQPADDALRSPVPTLPVRSLPDFPLLGRDDPRFRGRRHNAWAGPGLLLGYRSGNPRYGQIGAFSAAERAYLAELANHPAWRAFSTVARAPSADFFGARYALPFPDSVSLHDLPVPRFTGVKQLAYANGARAAFYLAQGRPADAERALRETVGFGFQLLDHGNTLIDELIGIVIVGIGRGQLIEFYQMTGRPEGQVLQSRLDSMLAEHDRAVAAPKPEPLSYAATRQALTRVALDTAYGRGMRFELLAVLGTAPCTNVRELIFGPGKGVDTTFARARRALARFPGDSAMIDMLEHAPERHWRSPPGTSLGSRALNATVHAAGWLLHSRRLRGCGEMLAWAGAVGD